MRTGSKDDGCLLEWNPRGRALVRHDGSHARFDGLGGRAGQRRRYRKRHRRICRCAVGSKFLWSKSRQRLAGSGEHGGLCVAVVVQRQLCHRHFSLGLLGDRDSVALRRRGKRGDVDCARALVQRRNGHARRGCRSRVHRHRVSRGLSGTFRLHDNRQSRPVRRQLLCHLHCQYNRRRRFPRRRPVVIELQRNLGGRSDRVPGGWK